MSKLSKQLSRPWVKSVVAATALACASGAWAQNAASAQAQPANVVQLSAEGSVDVVQDLLTATLSATREGRDAATVQSQLQKVVEAAMAVTKRSAQSGQMDVSTGSFGIYPRYGKDNKVEGWQGRAEILLQGRDFARITQTAAQVQDMTLSQVGFGLSREAREKQEADVVAQAIKGFKVRAADYAKQFDYSSFRIGEVNVNTQDAAPFAMAAPQMRMKATAMADEALPVEAGKATVSVTVSGSVLLSR